MEPPVEGAPGPIADLDIRWRDNDWKQSPLSWSRQQEDSGTSGSDAGDTRIPRSDQPQWQLPDDEAAAEGS